MGTAPTADTIEASRLSIGIFSLNHSAFADRSELLSDIGELLKTQLRPPSRRTEGFIKIDTQRGTYWRF